MARPEVSYHQAQENTPGKTQQASEKRSDKKERPNVDNGAGIARFLWTDEELEAMRDEIPAQVLPAVPERDFSGEHPQVISSDAPPKRYENEVFPQEEKHL